MAEIHKTNLSTFTGTEVGYYFICPKQQVELKQNQIPLSPERLSRLNRTKMELIRDGLLVRARRRGISMVELTIELPEEIERQLEAAWENLPRRALEALAVEGYRSGALTRGQVGLLLNLNFWETEAFLKERAAFLHYNSEDLEQDRLTDSQLRSE